MSLVVQTSNRVTPALKSLGGALAQRRGLHKAIADEAKVLVQGHFSKLVSSRRNPYGKRARFWPRMFRATRSVATAEEGQVAMPREMAQRYFGGTLTPKGGRTYLTIPARQEAYGKRAREFNFLEVLFGAGRKPVALVDRERQEVRKGKDGKYKQGKKHAGGLVYYWLVKSVTQAEDKSVLPTEGEFHGAIARGAERFLKRFAKP